MKRKTTLSLIILSFLLFVGLSKTNALENVPYLKEILAAPANDECANAASLTVNSNYFCSNVTPGTVLEATASTAPGGCTSSANATDDVWFKFVASDTDHRVEIKNIVGTGGNLHHMVYEGGASGGNCATMTPIYCGTTTTSDLNSLTVNNTYFIRVYTNALTSSDKTFDICVGTAPTVPTNDDCANAMAVALPHNDTYDATAATNNAGYIMASGCINMNDGVWYTIIGDGGDITVTVAPTAWNAGIAVYTGSCGSFTCVDDSNIGAVGVIEALTFTSTLNTTYYVNIAFPSNTLDGAEGIFTLDVNSSTLSIDEIIAKGFSYYPNPVNDVLKMRANENITQVSLYSVLGREIRRIEKSDLDVELDFSNLPAGTYYVRAVVGEKSGSFKVLKQ